MNGFFLMVPLLLMRYVLLGAFGKKATRRAAFFAPMVGHEKAAFYVYQLSTVAIFASALFLHVKTTAPWFLIGIIVFSLGNALCFVSMIHFAHPSESGVNRRGLYAISRNPMYVAYFLYLLGSVLLTRSPVLLALLVAFQASCHWLILSEERWCEKAFVEAYIHYKNKVRRYL